MSESTNLEKFKPTFENGGFWEYYLDLERQFQNFLEYVPYLKGNEDTYSFKLLSLILSIGGYIDSAFKEMARFPEFLGNEKCEEILRRAQERKGIIESGVEAFDNLYGISTSIVTFKFIPDREVVKPFECENTAPNWWDFYNELKHDVGINLQKANLKNARDALAGAFLLNALHKPGALRLFDYGLMKDKYIHRELMPEGTNRETFEYMLNHRRKYGIIIETPVFMYDYER
ncbi:MAG: hypothetical protein OEY22_05505 [Candidatus Bathyarchaeota archaeon]|nr:hypothetical protein [Candidatus Bathyarchaeota archaeon]MDH5788450.1 hypothetical protein [Candidatus Bathyarchaeota archaeon]